VETTARLVSTEPDGPDAENASARASDAFELAGPHLSQLLPRGAGGAVRLPSPLRYPGAKRQLIPLFNRLLVARPTRTFVEPFAGGASVGLHVAANGLAERVVLAEADPLVYSFWKTACSDNQWLIDQVATVNVSLKTWEHFKANPGRTRRERALACLFLNRTSFSGILHERAGPIGGRAQSSAYKIDCRFPRDELTRRLRLVGELAKSGRIAAVLSGDYQKTVSQARQRYGDDGLLLYLDPPFYAKAQTLYRRPFDDAGHRRLAAFVLGCASPWVLSYDHHAAIEDLYSTPLVRLPGEVEGHRRPTHRLERLTLTYTAHSRRGSGDEYIVTNLPHLPTEEINA
jgi:DNA adenine methylase